MEKKVLIENVRWYPTATALTAAQLTETMLQTDSKELLLLPDSSDPTLYRGIVLSKFYTPLLSDSVNIRDCRQEGDFQIITFPAYYIRGYLSYLARKILMSLSSPEEDPSAHLQTDLDRILSMPTDASPAQERVKPTEHSAFLQFLQNNTPATIEQALNQVIIGQPALTEAVASFLYYHALRQIHPQLPQRPLLIAGPSGSGKTEVWRAAGKLYGKLFPIKVIDGSSLSCEGWSGNYKIDTFVDATIVNGGILVVDEFDKLARPKHSSGGDNVSLDMQAEFLKLMEGEYQLTERRKQTNLTSQKMGFALVGAFESLRSRKEQPKKAASQIGFCAPSAGAAPIQRAEMLPFTDEDFISYGIMPEIVGRIATKCMTVPLSEQAYIDIVRGPHSRVAQIEQVLKTYGVEISDLISTEEIRKLVTASKNNKTGVRWVSAQVESRLLEAIREGGLFPTRAHAS